MQALRDGRLLMCVGLFGNLLVRAYREFVHPFGGAWIAEGLFYVVGGIGVYLWFSRLRRGTGVAPFSAVAPGVPADRNSSDRDSGCS